MAADAARRRSRAPPCARRRRCRRSRPPRRCAPRPSGSAARASSSLQGDRATLTFTGVPFEALRDWLGEARSAARARPIEAQLLKARVRLQRLDLGRHGGQPRDRAASATAALVSRPSPPPAGASRRSPSRLGRGARRRGALGRRRRARSASLAGLVLFAPAAWLASAVASATDERLILADARGTIWSGSAVAGPHRRRRQPRRQLRCPAASSGRSRRAGYGVEVAARQDCCLQRHDADPAPARARPHPRDAAAAAPSWVGQWPSAWLGGLGTPWNTLQLGGSFAPDVAGRHDRVGRGPLAPRRPGRRSTLDGVSSRLTTLDTLGSYRVTLSGGGSGRQRDPAVARRPWTARCSSPAAAPGAPAASSSAARRGRPRPTRRRLSNLLNIIGRRDGARSIISIG